jgi:hypothetical protein
MSLLPGGFSFTSTGIYFEQHELMALFSSRNPSSNTIDKSPVMTGGEVGAGHTTEVVPCYKAQVFRVFQHAGELFCRNIIGIDYVAGASSSLRGVERFLERPMLDGAGFLSQEW